MDSTWIVFLSEFLGTAVLVLLGDGVVANVVLAKTKGNNGGTLMVNFAWGFAVYIGVLVAFNSGGLLNPAVTLGLLADGKKDFATGVPVNFGTTVGVIVAEILGAFIGAILVWLAYKKHFDEESEPGNILGVFSTGPAIRSYAWNLVTEIIGTFMLVLCVIAFGGNPAFAGSSNTASSAIHLGPISAIPVALLVVVIGASLGGPTGYAINPARDLGPRLAHAILPIPNKGGNDWSYSWVPILGPIIGGLIAGWLAPVLLPLLGGGHL